MNIVLVEDEQDTREELAEMIMSWGHVCHPMGCGEEALQFMRSEQSVDLIVFDINMPGTTGLEMLEELRSDSDSDVGSVHAICMTGDQDPRLILTALKSGISDFQFKPIEPGNLKQALNKVELDLKMARSRSSETTALRDQIDMQSKMMEELTSELCDAQRESLTCLAFAAEHKDATTGAHLARMGAYARRMAELLGWSEDRCSAMELAAPLHDVGKIGIPDDILLKKGRLTSDEYELMKRHTIFGADILSRARSPIMRLGSKIALYHHEAFDGTGYPKGLTGGQIPMEAAITSLVDVYDALRSSRPYKDTMAHSTAVDIMCNGDDRTQVSRFHPELLAMFLKHHRDFDQIYMRCSTDIHGPVPDITDFPGERPAEKKEGAFEIVTKMVAR